MARLSQIVQSLRGRLVLPVDAVFRLAEQLTADASLRTFYTETITKLRLENKTLRSEVRRLQQALRDAEIVVTGLDDRNVTVSPAVAHPPAN